MPIIRIIPYNSFRRQFAILLFYFQFSLSTHAQTTNISGMINTYHSVTEILPSKAGIKADNTTGITYGDLVVLVQMKGADIITTNNSTFGDTTSLNNAGNYEIATVCSISGDTVFFFNNVMNNYTPADRVQMVKFGNYLSADVIDTLKALSWNNSTGKGGVLAISVEEDLVLHAPIIADSSGYRGASFYLHSGTCGFFNPVGTGYVYDATSATSANGAYKGEGVADVPSTLDGARGAPANGGGGGNNHNNGGGGGANLTSGGNGGGNFSTGPSGCTGNYQGIGGKPLNTWSNSKIFAGGGGGAGHANSTVQPFAGGNGGGIIIVIAKNIIGNGYKISANGQNGRSTSYDGASGGGAGGTIIMHVINGYTGALTIQANGGNGGNEDDDLSAGRCYGAGGGGSGGVIYFNGSVPAITNSVTGGTAGINIDPNGCAAPVPAQNGTGGNIVTGYSYKASVDPSSYCDGILPVRLIKFIAQLTAEKKVLLTWEIANPSEAKVFYVERQQIPNNWVSLGFVSANEMKLYYQYTDDTPVIGQNIYRLRIIAHDNTESYSPIKKVIIKEKTDFEIYPNPAKNKITLIRTKPGTAFIKLFDISGKLILQKQVINNPATIHLPGLFPGIYFIQLGEKTMKLIIQ